MKNKIQNIICGLLCAALCAGLFGCNINFDVDYPQINEIDITVEKSATNEEIAAIWFTSFTQIYSSNQVPVHLRLDTYRLHSREDLPDPEGKRVKITFSYTAVKPEKYTCLWDGVVQDGQLCNGVWILYFSPWRETEDIPSGMVTYSVRPQSLESYEAAYTEPVQNSYKIVDDLLYITYNGFDWIEVPLLLDKLENYVAGHFPTDHLPDGSYIISPEKTVFMYGGFSVPLTCLYSDDAGETWHSSEVEQAPHSIEQKVISFPDSDIGFMAVGHGRTVTWIACDLYSTTDGGATWQHIRSGPGEHHVSSFAFFDEYVGFLSYSSSWRCVMDICTTRDGGFNWYVVKLQIPDEYAADFTQAEVPTKDGDMLELLVGENEQSGYSMWQDHYLRYTSFDFGVTWNYEGVICIPYQPD